MSHPRPSALALAFAASLALSACGGGSDSQEDPATPTTPPSTTTPTPDTPTSETPTSGDGGTPTDTTNAPASPMINPSCPKVVNSKELDILPCLEGKYIGKDINGNACQVTYHAQSVSTYTSAKGTWEMPVARSLNYSGDTFGYEQIELLSSLITFPNNSDVRSLLFYLYPDNRNTPLNEPSSITIEVNYENDTMETSCYIDKVIR